MLELLAPAGSMEAVVAAVENGADAVYLGYGDFNARRNAKNFSQEEFASAVSYCHARGTKVYLTLNTLLTDRELPGAADLACHASDIGIDAVIVQDLGVARMLRQSVPDLPIHGSTQMTIHDLDGVLECADLGMTRVVLSRELSRDQMAYICQRAPIEIEVFGHGALCMCYSGQCFFSSVIGGRSGNRGLCAQPCRMKYGWNGKADQYPLSLKDMSLARHLQELQDMGVACLKLEGRMKRPEYVAIITGVYARALRENREPTQEEMKQLEQAFSRQGFTEGYYQGKLGPKMFGTRQAEEEPKELFSSARATYQNGENRKEPVKFYALLESGIPAQIAVQDKEGRTAHAEGPLPEKAINVPLTPEKVEKQLARTGGTPYRCQRVIARVEEGLSLPLSTLNALRRDALEELSRQRMLAPARRHVEFRPGVRYENPKEPPVYTVSVRTADQLTTELLALKPALVYLPTDVGAAHPERVRACQEAGVPVAALLPRICSDFQLDTLDKELAALRELGVTEALCGNLGLARHARELGFALRADYGLGVYNSHTMKELKRLGFLSATLSFEMKLAQIRDLNKTIPSELLAYGRLPLMITENCIIHNHTCKHNCNACSHTLTDRKGEHFPVVQAWGCRNEILNAKTLFLADRTADHSRLGLWAARLAFTTESPQECVRVMEAYLGRSKYQPDDFTRGLYYRDVE